MKNRKQHEIVYQQLRQSLGLKRDYEAKFLIDIKLLELTNTMLIQLHCIPLSMDEIEKLLN
jgi:ornithine carbamoyltransferase